MHRFEFGWRKAASRTTLLALSVGLFLACAIPGRLYTVAPMVSGQFELNGRIPSDAVLSLRLRHRESPGLHHRSDTTLSADGKFAFPAVQLAIGPCRTDLQGHLFVRLRE